MTDKLFHIKCTVRKYIVEQILFKNDDSIIDFDQPLIEQGIVDSIALMALVQFLENEFDILISKYDLESNNFKTVDTISQMVSKLKSC